MMTIEETSEVLAALIEGQSVEVVTTDGEVVPVWGLRFAGRECMGFSPCGTAALIPLDRVASVNLPNAQPVINS